MTGVLAFFGSGEFTSAMKEVDTYLLGLTPAPAVLVIPGADGLNHGGKIVEEGIGYYQSIGVEVGGLELVNNAQANDRKISKELEKYTYFFFAGGNPGYLLHLLKDSLAWKTLLKLYSMGATIVGASDSIIPFGKWSWTGLSDFEQEGIISPWAEGLGIIEPTLLPRFNQIEPSLTSERRTALGTVLPREVDIVGIDENTAYIYAGREWFKKGKGKIHRPVDLS